MTGKKIVQMVKVYVCMNLIFFKCLDDIIKHPYKCTNLCIKNPQNSGKIMINKTGLFQPQFKFSLAKTAYLLPSQPTKLDAIWQMTKLSKMGFCIHIDFKTHNFLAFQDDYGGSSYTP